MYPTAQTVVPKWNLTDSGAPGLGSLPIPKASTRTGSVQSLVGWFWEMCPALHPGGRVSPILTMPMESRGRIAPPRKTRRTGNGFQREVLGGPLQRPCLCALTLTGFLLLCARFFLCFLFSTYSLIPPSTSLPFLFYIFSVTPAAGKSHK